ncbi:MAG: glycosyltransferase family 2 protein [Gammaproteobacteria bacterium]
MPLTDSATLRLSVVIITLNVADRLAPCLDSVQELADEVVVCDGGSTDSTRELAEARGARVIVERNWRGFGIQRQRAQAEAQGEWVLMIDSDERLTPGLRDEIRAALDANTPDAAYTLPRLSWVFGRYIRHGGWWPDRVLRLYRREQGDYNDALVHERVELVKGVHVHDLTQPLLHHTYRDMREYLVKSADYSAAWAQQRKAAGRKTSIASGLTHALSCFLRMYVVRAGFLDGRAGFLLALLSAHSTFVKYADLWLRDHDPGPP